MPLRTVPLHLMLYKRDDDDDY